MSNASSLSKAPRVWPALQFGTALCHEPSVTISSHLEATFLTARKRKADFPKAANLEQNIRTPVPIYVFRGLHKGTQGHTSSKCSTRPRAGWGEGEDLQNSWQVHIVICLSSLHFSPAKVHLGPSFSLFGSKIRAPRRLGTSAPSQLGTWT